MLNTCRECGATFSGRLNRRYCSPRCRREAERAVRAHRDAERTRRYLRTLPDVERNLILQLDGARVLTPLYDGGTPNDR